MKRVLQTTGAALSVALLFSVIGGNSSNAATVESFANGWYSQANNSNNDFTAGVININVGWNTVTGSAYRNWLAFNLTGLTNQVITSATLTFYGGNGTYSSPKASETLGLFDYTGSINALLGGQTGVGIYKDLGTGASYGQATVSNPLGQFSVTLTGAALAALNAAAHNAGDNRFVIGGALLTMALIHDGDNWYNDGQLFLITGPQAALNHAAFLSLETSPVPIPAVGAAVPLLFGGAGVLGYWRRRKSAKSAA